MRVGPFAFRYQGNGATPANIIDTIPKAYTAYTARTPCTGRVRAVYTAKSVYRAVFTTVIRPCTAVYTAENVYTAV